MVFADGVEHAHGEASWFGEAAGFDEDGFAASVEETFGRSVEALAVKFAAEAAVGEFDGFGVASGD